MTSDLQTVIHTEDQISEYFVLEAQMLSTRTADLYKALDKSRGTHISLWVYRQPLALNSPVARQFLSRMASLQRLEGISGNILSYGIDSIGVPFCVFPNLNGHSILQGNIEIAEADRRFISCLRLLEKLHSAGIVCGDITGSSFWVERSGDIKFIGVMGSFDKHTNDDIVLPTSELENFIPPEQLKQSEPEQTMDVYALGVIGYKLITGCFPNEKTSSERTKNVLDGNGVEHFRAPEKIKPVSQLVQNPPLWADQVLLTCLNPHPSDRYSNANSIISAIARIRENFVNSEKAPTRIARDADTAKTTEAKAIKIIPSTKSEQASEEKEDLEELEAPLKSSALFAKAAIVMILVSGVSFVFFKDLFKVSDDSGSGMKSALEMHGQALQDNEIKQGLAGASGTEAENIQREAYFKKMILSDDPIYHDLLIKAAKEAKTEQERGQAETAILDRARRLGLRRSAEVVRPWLKGVKLGQANDVYEAVLRALDATLPIEARNSAIRQAYANNPRVVMKLAAALALDTGKFDQYREVLSQLVGDATKEDLSSRSALGVILFSTDLVSAFGDDVVQRKEQIPDGDVIWLLNVLAQRNDINVRAISSLAVDRKLLEPMRQFYLTSIRDRDDLPGEVVSALVKAAAGALTRQEVAVFGMWYDKLAEEVLLALCADQVTEDVKIEAFEILAGKTIAKEPVNSLIQWVRKNQWENKANFVNAIGVFANIESFDNSQIDAAMMTFDPYMKDQVLLNAFLSSERSQLVSSVLRQYSKRVGLGRRLTLLGHSSKEVRILAVKSLDGLNDVAGLKLVLDQYAKEKDEEVKKAYQGAFWVIKEKEERMAAGASQ